MGSLEEPETATPRREPARHGDGAACHTAEGRKSAYRNFGILPDAGAGLQDAERQHRYRVVRDNCRPLSSSASSATSRPCRSNIPLGSIQNPRQMYGGRPNSFSESGATHLAGNAKPPVARKKAPRAGGAERGVGSLENRHGGCREPSRSLFLLGDAEPDPEADLSIRAQQSCRFWMASASRSRRQSKIYLVGT
jgi:hypothetical protein